MEKKNFSLSTITILVSVVTVIVTAIGKYYNDISDLRRSLYILENEYRKLDEGFTSFYEDFIEYELKKVILELSTTDPSASESEREKYINLRARKLILERFKSRLSEKEKIHEESPL